MEWRWRRGWTGCARSTGTSGISTPKVDPVATYDDKAHTLSFAVQYRRRKAYQFGALMITGLSVAAEKHLRDAWPIPPEDELFDKDSFRGICDEAGIAPGEIFGNCRCTTTRSAIG